MDETPEAAGRGASGTELYRHFADEQVVAAVAFALDTVAQLDPDADLRLAVFNAAWGARTAYYADKPRITRVPAHAVPKGG